MVEVLHIKCHENLNYGSHNSNNSAKLHICIKALKLTLCCEHVINYICVRTQLREPWGPSFKSQNATGLKCHRNCTASATTKSVKGVPVKHCKCLVVTDTLRNIHSQGSFETKSFPMLFSLEVTYPKSEIGLYSPDWP